MSESIFRVKLLPDGRLEFEDCRGNVGACAPDELGARFCTVLRDPSLPPIERISAGGYNIAEVLGRHLLPPEYQQLVRPAASMVMQAVQRLMMAAQGGQYARAASYQQQQQQRQQNPPSPPQDPHRNAHRRGRRVA